MTSSQRRLTLSGVIGFSLLLAACSAPIDSAAPIATSAALVTSAPSVTVQPSPTVVPPTQPPPQPTATAVPTEVVVTPTVSAAESPACTSPAVLTPAQTEGPYYTPNTPERTSLLEPGMGGTKVIVTGYVLTTDCQPIANAWLDFWQADDQGVYDNAGYRLRGHLFTAEDGRYTLETIVPGEYPGRTPHIHVKVQAPNGSILTSQIYFPGVAANDRDSIFDPALLAEMQDTIDGKQATFNFVVRP
jgi:protocatechuate 3,4-dioxygenase beta subunit